MAAGVLLVGAAKRIDRALAGRAVRSARIEARTDELLTTAIRLAPAHRLRSSAHTYDAYLREEIAKSLRMSSAYCLERRATAFLHRHVYPRQLATGHAGPLAAAAAACLETAAAGRRVLSVGCRDELELLVLEKVFEAPVVGLDLFSLGPAIRCGDMHAMPFADGEFDALVSCHSLEHSFAPDVALAEFLRVLKPGGVLAIEVPCRGTSSGAPRRLAASASDRWDFGNAATLLKQIEACTTNALTIVLSRDVASGRSGAVRAAQLVVRVGRA